MKQVIISRGELAFPESLGAKLRDHLFATERNGGVLKVVIAEWAEEGDGIIRSGGPLGAPVGQKVPINNF